METQFIITPEILHKCKEFAQASVSSSVDKYARRDQMDVEKIKKDIYCGKLGEEAVYEKLLSKFPDLTPPDHQVYDKGMKSWDPDLKAGPLKIAVKSQNVDSRLAFEESWVFQMGNGKKDCDSGIFKEEDTNHYVAFVALNVPKRKGEIRAILPVKWLHQHGLFKPMQKENLRSNKVAVYYEDLEKTGENLFQI